MKTISLEIITQEKEIFSGAVAAVTAPGTDGELTVLPDHIPLFTRLKPGTLRFLHNNRWQTLVIAGGFMDVAPRSQTTVLADSAVRVEELNIAKAEAAKRRAEEDLKKDLSKKDYAKVTASLRRAVIELDLARKYRRQRPMGQQAS